MADCYGLNSDHIPDDAFPVSYTLPDHKQKKDKTLLKQAQTMTCAYSLKKFHVVAFAYCATKIKLWY
jgi:hypothetical protein